MGIVSGKKLNDFLKSDASVLGASSHELFYGWRGQTIYEDQIDSITITAQPTIKDGERCGDEGGNGDEILSREDSSHLTKEGE